MNSNLHFFTFKDLDRPHAADLLIAGRTRADAWETARELLPDARLACVGRDPMWIEITEPTADSSASSDAATAKDRSRRSR